MNILLTDYGTDGVHLNELYEVNIKLTSKIIIWYFKSRKEATTASIRIGNLNLNSGIRAVVDESQSRSRFDSIVATSGGDDIISSCGTGTIMAFYELNCHYYYGRYLTSHTDSRSKMDLLTETWAGITKIKIPNFRQHLFFPNIMML